jgi:hypothetical protein
MSQCNRKQKEKRVWNEDCLVDRGYKLQAANSYKWPFLARPGGGGISPKGPFSHCGLWQSIGQVTLRAKSSRISSRHGEARETLQNLCINSFEHALLGC